MTVVLFTNLLSSSTQGQMLKFEFHRVPFGIHNSPKFSFFLFFLIVPILKNMERFTNLRVILVAQGTC